MNCKIDGCGNRARKRGWCEKHYGRWRTHGDPDIVNKEHHGYSKHILYKVWKGMKARCYNPNDIGYHNYGGRGIIVCDEWKNSAKAFVEWAFKNGWEKGLQIDRRDNDGNYAPENCGFITYTENIHNCRLIRNTNTSGYRGVCFHKRHKKWMASIRINDNLKHLGYFNSPELAAMAYDNAVPDNRPKNKSPGPPA